jgi:hypothetical protein
MPRWTLAQVDRQAETRSDSVVVSFDPYVSVPEEHPAQIRYKRRSATLESYVSQWKVAALLTASIPSSWDDRSPGVVYGVQIPSAPPRSQALPVRPGGPDSILYCSKTAADGPPTATYLATLARPPVRFEVRKGSYPARPDA